MNLIIIRLIKYSGKETIIVTDIIRLTIPLVAAVLPSLGVLIASKFVTTKINYYKLEDVVKYRLKIVHKIAAVISYILFVFIVYIYITLYLYAGLEFLTVWPIWIPLAIYIMIFIHIFRNYRYSHITIDDEGITYKVFMGRKKYISYVNIAGYNLKPYQDRFILRSSTGKKVVVRPVGMSLNSSCSMFLFVSLRVVGLVWIQVLIAKLWKIRLVLILVFYTCWNIRARR